MMLTKKEISNLAQDEPEAQRKVEQVLAWVVSLIVYSDDSMQTVRREAESASSRHSLQGTCKGLNRIDSGGGRT